MADNQVLCIGNAIVDIIARVDEEFLTAHERVKGAMMLVDEEMSARLYEAMPPATERSGGSAGNTAAGIASFGGNARFIGKVRDDQLGAVFSHDIRAAGVAFESAPLTADASTATSMILVTPDGQRTMNTYLGACGYLSPDDIVESEVAAAQITYVEGYLWDRPAAKDAVVKAMDVAHKHDRLVSLTLSDSFCVDRWRGEFRDLVRERVDILFANEEEIKSLYEVDSFDEALAALQAEVRIGALTRSEKGSVVLTAEKQLQVAAAPTSLVDSTGAGDLYAAGFLYGLTHGFEFAECGALGSIAAAEVISHIGARPEVSLKTLAQDRGLSAA